MAEADIDCRKIWESIEQDTNNLLQKDISERMRASMLEAINERVEKMHKDIDLKGEEFINQIIGSFKDQEDEVLKEGETKKLSRSEQKEKELREKKLAEINSLTDEIEKDYQIQMLELKDALEKVVRRTSVIDGSCEIFKSKEMSKLLIIGKDEFKIRVPREIGALLKGKSNFELTWDSSKNKSTYCTVDKEDSSILKINGVTCYTYYQTAQTLKDEDITIEIEYKIDGTDDYWYLGFINEKVVPSSNCMCCTISNAFYLQSSGDIILDAKRQTDVNMRAEKGKVQNVIFKIALSTKEMYITLNDKEEKGPFKVSGDTFTFTAGSCNSKNGYVKILNAYYG